MPIRTTPPAIVLRTLGLHRTQLSRLVERHGLTIDAVDTDDDEAIDQALSAPRR
jgi:hypothetical protein